MIVCGRGRQLPEPGVVDDGQEIGGVEHGAADDGEHRQIIFRLQGTTQDIPLGNEAGRGWHTDHGQCTDGKRRHGPWHAAGDAVQLVQLCFVCRHIDRAGRKEQGDLAKCMGHHVYRRTHFRQGLEHRRRQHDVGKLADGGIG